MAVLITKQFRFESAHYLPGMPEGHKCRRIHGHSFIVDIQVLGEVDPLSGIVMDFGDIKKLVQPLINHLDHWLLNEVGERDNDDLLRNPTSENLARWFFEKVKPMIPGLYSVIVHETCTSRCEYRASWS
jgi:6-pyruvoyltetrahydropterin/6-carboxytetrahydropterin synthase